MSGSGFDLQGGDVGLEAAAGAGGVAVAEPAGAAGTQRGEHRDDAAVREHARQSFWGARVERLEQRLGCVWDNDQDNSSSSTVKER